MSLTEYDEEACIRTWQEDGFVKGLSKGMQEKAINAAKNALAMNLTVEQVSSITELPIEQVRELKKQVMA